MATTMSSHSFAANAKVLSPKCSTVGFPALGLVDCIHNTAFALSKGIYLQLCLYHASQHSLTYHSKRSAWSIRSSADGRELDPPRPNNSNSGTRLNRAFQALRNRLSARLKELRKGLPMKLLFFLVGFYCATAFATVIGQTGDWDILSAALAVAIVEAIGALMYKASFPMFDRIRSLITMFNYWKAGLSLGLFLDSFKYEMDNLVGFCNFFPFELDEFPIFL